MTDGEWPLLGEGLRIAFVLMGTPAEKHTTAGSAGPAVAALLAIRHCGRASAITMRPTANYGIMEGMYRLGTLPAAALGLGWRVAQA